MACCLCPFFDCLYRLVQTYNVAYFSFWALNGHRRRSSCNIGARYFCPKIMYEEITKMPGFYTRNICLKNYQNPGFLMIFARKMPEFYMIIFRKIVYFFWEGARPLSSSYTPIHKWTTNQYVLVIIIGLMACAPLEIIVPRLCPGSEIFLAPPLN